MIFIYFKIGYDTIYRKTLNEDLINLKVLPKLLIKITMKDLESKIIFGNVMLNYSI